MCALENSVIRVGRVAKSMWMTDFSDLQYLRNFPSPVCRAHACVTVGFCNSVEIQYLYYYS
jgi:hypothetical protein